MKNKIIAEEIAKELNVSVERVIEGIENLEINIYDTAKDAFMDVMDIDYMNAGTLSQHLLQEIEEKLDNESPLDKWVNNYDGIIKLSSGVAYVKQSFYNN